MKTNLIYKINENLYNVFVKQGASRKTYYIKFNSGKRYIISAKDCKQV